MANKYGPLEKYLLTADADVVEITVSFSELRKILGCELPSAAVNHRAWWGNQRETTNRPQAHAWMTAGFVVDSVSQDLKNGWVKFKRQAQVNHSPVYYKKDSSELEALIERKTMRPERIVKVVSSTIYLVSCVKRKRDTPSAARDLYVSEWFVKARAYVERSRMPWFILSAEYGLVEPTTIIAPYEKTLKALSGAERRRWAEMVIEQMKSSLPQSDCAVVLAGSCYRKLLIDYLDNRYPKVCVPMAGLGIGEQLSWLSQH